MLAGSQTAGRGRFSRIWFSPPGAGLYVSVICRHSRAAPFLTLAGGVAVAATVDGGRAWRIGQTRTVVSHRLVCPGTVDERVEEVVAGKRHVADLVLPKSSSLTDLDASQLRTALGLRPDSLLAADLDEVGAGDQEAA